MTYTSWITYSPNPGHSAVCTSLETSSCRAHVGQKQILPTCSCSRIAGAMGFHERIPSGYRDHSNCYSVSYDFHVVPNGRPPSPMSLGWHACVNQTGRCQMAGCHISDELPNSLNLRAFVETRLISNMSNTVHSGRSHTATSREGDNFKSFCRLEYLVTEELTLPSSHIICRMIQHNVATRNGQRRACSGLQGNQLSDASVCSKSEL